MIKSVDGLNKRLASIEKDILSLKSDIALEKENNNRVLNGFIEELDIIREDVSEILFEKYKAIVPTDENPALRELFNESEQYRSIMKMMGKDSLFIERFGFDKTIYEVGNGTNVDQLNDALKNFILEMDSLGIELDYHHFNYSVFSTKYMKVFFENLENENYQIIMKKCFVNIYWECPQLLVHLEMCVRCLIYENKSIIVKHLNKVLNDNLRNISCDKDELIPLFSKTRRKFINLRDEDFYHIYSFFRKSRNEIDKYVDKNHFYNVLGRYIDVNIYNSYSDEDRKFFVTNINRILQDLGEYRMISKFRGIFYYLADLYKNPKVDAEAQYKIARSDANKYEAIKNKLDRRLNLLFKKRDYLTGKNKERLNKVNEQIKELSLQVSTEITAIKNEIDLVGDLRFVLDFKEEITATSNVYEVVYFVSKYYGALCEIAKANNLVDEDNVIKFVDEFRQMQYSPYVKIMNSISFLEIDSVRELIERNYSMHDIKLNLPVSDESLLGIMDDLKYIVRYHRILDLDISPDDIKVLLNVDEKMEALEG